MGAGPEGEKLLRCELATEGLASVAPLNVNRDSVAISLTCSIPSGEIAWVSEMTSLQAKKGSHEKNIMCIFYDWGVLETNQQQNFKEKEYMRNMKSVKHGTNVFELIQ